MLEYCLYVYFHVTSTGLKQLKQSLEYNTINVVDKMLPFNK